MTRDRHRQLTDFQKAKEKEAKTMSLSRSLRKEVEIGANGTQKYVIKEGINKGKITKDFDKWTQKIYYTKHSCHTPKVI